MKKNLIKQLNSARKRLLSALLKVPDEGILIDKWGKKEIVAHLAGWEEEYVACMPQVLSGAKPRSFKISIDRFNEQNVNQRKHRTVEDILKELASLRIHFLDQINQLPEDQINIYKGTVLGKKKINILWVINEAISHDNDHAKELEELKD